MTGRKWTKEEEQALYTYYGSATKKVILECLKSRTWNAIKLHAEKQQISYHTEAHKQAESNLNILLEDTPLAFYWMGLLSADGHFEKTRVTLHLANKDREHVVRFANFIECPNHHAQQRNRYIVSSQDRFTVPKINKKFKLCPTKTYHPPDITWISGDLLTSFICGFIDGDGCIRQLSGRRDANIQIKLHASWLGVLQYMSDALAKYAGVSAAIAKINKKGYASLVLANCKVLRFLKNKAIALNLPVLERKWSRIDESMISRYETTITNRSNVLLLKAQGLMQKQIALKLGLSEACVSLILKKERANAL